jgi:hypothetical protein
MTTARILGGQAYSDFWRKGTVGSDILHVNNNEGSKSYYVFNSWVVVVRGTADA